MRTIILLGFLVLAAIAFVACTESSTQWEHKRQSEQRELDDAVPLEDRVDNLERRIKVLELLESNKVR